MRSQTPTSTYDITLPQLTGGSAPVRERFNSAVHAALSDALTDQTGTAGDGELPYNCDESSRITHIGAHVVAGVLITTHYSGGAHPNTELGTIVVDADTAQPIHLSQTLRDPTRAWNTLAALAPTLVPAGEPPLDPPTAASDTFADWVPSPTGLTIYFEVPHVLGDFHPILIPWTRIRDLFTPPELAVLSS